jgi:HEAT repeat protein
VSQGLKTTFEVLSTTENDAASPVLVSALDSCHAAIREGALRGLLARRSLVGEREVVRRLHLFDARWRSIVSGHRGGMSRAIRDAILGKDVQTCVNGCAAVLWFHEFELIPALATVAEDAKNPNADLAAGTLLELAETLYEGLVAPQEYRSRRDAQIVRHSVTVSLEHAVERFKKHKRPEVIEAFLILAERDNATLKRILQDPHHGSYLAILDMLLRSGRSGVLRLLLGYLDDPSPPLSAIAALGKRNDLKFLDHLTRRVGREPSSVILRNLKRLASIPWLRTERAILDELDEPAQEGMVQLVMASSVHRLEVFEAIEHLMVRGKAAGRRAASKALAEFNGAAANALAVKGLDDADPEVRANVIVQLRWRGIPGVLPRMVDLADSPHEIVRSAVRQSLGEFTVERFLSVFDVLDEEARHNTAALVRKIDAESIPTLADELGVLSRSRRLRALAVVDMLEAARQVEESVIALLADEDHLIRAEAARVLGGCNSHEARAALQEALFDRSIAVAEAAQRSLEEFKAVVATEPQRARQPEPERGVVG